MTLQELRYVVALADAGHFGHAAEACFVSQSTLSTQIKKLEDYLGIILFDRSLAVILSILPGASSKKPTVFANYPGKSRIPWFARFISASSPHWDLTTCPMRCH
jgi:hypothetical protein